MRKTIIGSAASPAPAQDHEWLDLEFIARVEVTSEDPAYPLESALDAKAGGEGWRAALAGEQKITILFDGPTLIHLIHLEFTEPAVARTQEFTLTWTGVNGTQEEIVRQQWNFSPSGSTAQVENFRVNLAGVRVLELTVKPDIGGGSAVASLRRLRLA